MNIPVGMELNVNQIMYSSPKKHDANNPPLSHIIELLPRGPAI